jgi:hypothetical protein
MLDTFPQPTPGARILTRSEENGLGYYRTLREAFKAATADVTIWKIAYCYDNYQNRARLVRSGDTWTNQPINFFS